MAGTQARNQQSNESVNFMVAACDMVWHLPFTHSLRLLVSLCLALSVSLSLSLCLSSLSLWLTILDVLHQQYSLVQSEQVGRSRSGVILHHNYASHPTGHLQCCRAVVVGVVPGEERGLVLAIDDR